MSGVTVQDFKDIVIPEAKIKLGETSAFMVYGLDMKTLIVCFQNNLDLLNDLLNGEAVKASKEMMTLYPELAARVIAAATGSMEEDAISKARKLPIGVQMECLLRIFELSFPDSELLGKFWARLEELVEKVTAAYRA